MKPKVSRLNSGITPRMKLPVGPGGNLAGKLGYLVIGRLQMVIGLGSWALVFELSALNFEPCTLFFFANPPGLTRNSKVQSTKFKVQSTKFKVQSTKFKVQRPKTKDRSSYCLLMTSRSGPIEAIRNS